MRKLLVLIHLTLVVFLYSYNSMAQIQDPTQRKDWYYLQTLSEQIAQIQQCIMTTNLSEDSDKNKWDKAWLKYYRLTDELGKEVRLYIEKYSDKRSDKQTVDGFAFSVWDVVGIKAYSAKEEIMKDNTLCPVYLDY